MTHPGGSVAQRTAARVLSDVLANAADWGGSLDVDAVVEELRARGWRVAPIPPDHPDHPSKQTAREPVGAGVCSHHGNYVGTTCPTCYAERGR